jgi:hypothetical protein
MYLQQKLSFYTKKNSIYWIVDYLNLCFEIAMVIRKQVIENSFILYCFFKYIFISCFKQLDQTIFSY